MTDATLKAEFRRTRTRERAVHAAKQSASNMYFRARVYAIMRTVAIAAVIGIAVAVLHRYT